MTRAEIPQNWFYVPAKLWNVFPPHHTVTVNVKRQAVELKVNGYGYMSPEFLLSSEFYRLLGFDKENDTLVFQKGRDGSIELTVEKGPQLKQVHD
jgi:hypothetical protein